MTEYAGLATRTLAFAVGRGDHQLVAWCVAVVVALGLSLLKVPDDVVTVMAVIGARDRDRLGHLLLRVLLVGYRPDAGQPACSASRCVRAESGEPPHLGRAVVRVLCLPLAAIPLCAGFLMILVERRRRALQDVLVGTVVIYAREPEPVPTHVPVDSAEALH